jgi:ASC-1-like (ASCH) protein
MSTKIPPIWVIVIIVVVILVIIVGTSAYIQNRARKASMYIGGGCGGGDGHWYGDDDLLDDMNGGFEGGARPFRLATREPWYEYATKGKKLVWGRLRTGPFAEDAKYPLKVGDPVVVARSRAKGDETEYGKPYRYTTEITHLKEYDDFKSMLKGEGMAKVFPGTKTEAAAMKVYSEFYDEAAMQGAKVLAVCVKAPTAEALKVV